MEDKGTIKDITTKVENASTTFERSNTELKRKYLVLNIDTFNSLASRITSYRGSFGTGYPFYALDDKLEGKLPIIGEQIRYNRQLVKDGKQIQTSIWKCRSCLDGRYHLMEDLKKICKPCPNMLDSLKPRKIINRLPDLDMWVICEDGQIDKTEQEMTRLLDEMHMYSSDINPLKSIDDVENISNVLKRGEMPRIFLPIDAHIIEYSKIKELIEAVPSELDRALEMETIPYLPIHPKSYRKKWQYDDEAYNYVYDYLSAFTSFNFPDELQDSLDRSRLEVSTKYTPEELFEILLQTATNANFRRFHTDELEKVFLEKMNRWKNINSIGITRKTDESEPKTEIEF